MDISFEKFTDQLRFKLKQPLPGSKAHLQMAPYKGRVVLPHKTILNNAKQASVLALFTYVNNSIQLIFIERAVSAGVHSAQIAFPGGKREKHDIDFKATALRETNEEIGIPSEDIMLLGKLTDVYIPPSNFLVYPYVGYVSKPINYSIQVAEVQKVIPIKLVELLDERNRALIEIDVRNAVLKNVPAFKINDVTIWGATAMMLAELLEISKF